MFKYQLKQLKTLTWVPLAGRIAFLLSLLLILGIFVGMAVFSAANLIAKGYHVRKGFVILFISFVASVLGAIIAVYYSESD